MKARFFTVLIIFFCFTAPSGAINPDSTTISILTLLPRDKAVYTIYGHTSIRVNNPSEHVDLVFNYGMFDSQQPYFVYNFLRGRTDYRLDFEYFPEYEYHYTLDNGTVIEQILNIPAADKLKLLEFLDWNIRPENCYYLYNYFFDNCTTRPRDLIEKYGGGKLIYQSSGDSTTFRHLVHQCTAPYPWLEFGIDLLIGAGADSLISYRNELFLPIKLMEGLANASVQDTLPADSLHPAPCVLRPIVSDTRVILRSQLESREEGFSLSSPLKIGIILLIHSFVFVICGLIFKRSFRIFFGLLFLQAALAGSLVFFFAFFSIHPCAFPNYNLLWLHPLHWIAFAGYCFKKSYPLFKWYHGTNFVLLSLFLVCWSLIPQELNVANIPFVLCLWVASGWYLLGARYEARGAQQRRTVKNRI